MLLFLVSVCIMPYGFSNRSAPSQKPLLQFGHNVFAIFALSLDELVTVPDSLCNERDINLGRSLSPEEGQTETQGKL